MKPGPSVLRGGWLLAAGVGLAISCGPEGGPRTDSQTNWYRVCGSNADCGGLACLCGICTRSCENDAGCDGLGEASCVQDSIAVAVCGGRTPPSAGLCLSTCDDSDCPLGQSCVAGACRPISDQPATVVVDPSERHQTLIGLGATLTFVENQVVNHPRRAELYEAMFADLGIDVLRLRNRFGYVGDDDLTTAGSIVEAATESLGETPTLMLTSWSPPAALKASGEQECRGDVVTCTLARDQSGEFDYVGLGVHWRASLEAYAAVGVVPDYIGIQNNPDFIPEAAVPGEGCRFLPAEGTTMQLVNGVGVDVEYPGLSEALDAVVAELEGLESPPSIAAPETAGILSVGDYMSVLDASQLGAVAHHLYDVDPSRVNRSGLALLGDLGADLQLPLFQTEMQADGPGTSVLLHHVLVDEGAEVSLQGVLAGPASLANVVPGMLIAMTPADYILKEPYHALRHFSRYTGPGWVRVGATVDVEGLLVSAWIAPGEEALTVVIVNPGLTDLDVRVDLGEFASRATSVIRTVFDGLERSAELGPLSGDGTLRVPGRAVVTVASQ